MSKATASLKASWKGAHSSFEVAITLWVPLLILLMLL